ncbi:MAG: 2-oxoacid:acceptor oxidoreductase subunit alpha [Bacillota bacterium]
MKKNIMIAGSAGQGLKTVNNILSNILFDKGFNVYSTKDYMSRIRGGHNFMKIRFGDEEITSGSNDIDILIALNKVSVTKHKDQLKDNGIIFYDGDLENIDFINLNTKELANELGNSKVSNIITIGAVIKLLGLNKENIFEIIKKQFKKDKLFDINKKAFNKGYSLVDSKYKLSEIDSQKDQMIINGNDAVGLGAAIGGVNFYAAYPMTPSTGIMNYLAKHINDLNIVVEQAEDEIGAINMALGASYGGIRAMTGTSGGGFSLMNETLGLVGVAELPLVIANVQRPGPATGMPTRTGQGDLSFVINSSQGEFPLMVTAPRSAKDAFYQTHKSLNYAEKYQMPFVVLTDQYLADTTTNFETFNLDELENKNYYFNNKEKSDIEDFKRYKFSDTGISPLAYPGQLKNSYVFADSHEHNEFGRITEDKDLRVKMVNKRALKIQTFIENDLEEPIYKGPDNPKYVLLSWGSTYGPCSEAVKDFEDIGLLSFNHVWPLPTKKLNEFKDNTTFITVENNSTGQFKNLIHQETDIKINKEILKYDGRPFTGQEIINKLKEVK